MTVRAVTKITKITRLYGIFFQSREIGYYIYNVPELGLGTEGEVDGALP